MAPLATLGLALVLLLALLAAGTLLGRRLGVHQWGLPEALLAGGLGLLLAPTGALPLIPRSVVALWDQLPLVLLTLVFASLLLGKPLPRAGGLWRPLSAQVLMALTLAFGQYLVAGLLVLLVLQPWLGVSPVMACLIEVAFEGGHGSAAAMGPSYARLGLESGQALGLAMATVGLLASTLVGGLVVLLGRRRGWLRVPAGAGADVQALGAAGDSGDEASPAGAAVGGGAGDTGEDLGAVARRWAVNLALAGVAVALGWAALEGLRLLADRVGGGLALVVEALPVFPLALLASLLLRWLLERTGLEALASARVQARIGTLSADLLIIAATACLDLSLLARDWLPLTLLASAGLAWNLAVLLLLAPRILPANWFERGLIEFGQATGVAASGLLLLNLVDPEDHNGTLTPFSIKQLLMQPLVAGGLITVTAPLALAAWGLPLWTALASVLVVLWIGLALVLARRSP